MRAVKYELTYIEREHLEDEHVDCLVMQCAVHPRYKLQRYFAQFHVSLTGRRCSQWYRRTSNGNFEERSYVGRVSKNPYHVVRGALWQPIFITYRVRYVKKNNFPSRDKRPANRDSAITAEGPN